MSRGSFLKQTCRYLGTAAVLVLTQSPLLADELRIGVPASLSGRFVAFGAQVQRGVEYGLETWKAVRGDTVAGHKITVIFGDTQSNNSLTITVMNKLVQSDKAHILIGPGASDIGAAAVPPWKQVAERPIWIVPGVSTTVAEKAVGADPYYFHTFPWTYHYHATNVGALKAALGAGKRVAVVFSDGAYGRAHIEYARKYLKENGFEVVGEELVREGASDFTPSLIKVRAQKPDLVYTLVQTSDAVLLTKQIRAMGLKAPYLIGTFQAATQEWKKAVGDVQECWTGVTTYMPGANFPADAREPKLFPDGTTFEANWRKRYNKETEYMEAGTYSSLMLALLAVEKAGSLDRDKVSKILGSEAYDTVMGPAKFEASETALHQAFSKLVVFQQQKVGAEFQSVIIYPAAVAKGKLQPCAME